MSIDSSHAAPATWTLNEVTFADGATATGSFTVDGTPDAFDATWNISVSASANHAAFVFDSSLPGSSDYDYSKHSIDLIAPGGGSRINDLKIFAIGSLLLCAPTLALNYVYIYECDSDCCHDYIFDNVNGGSATFLSLRAPSGQSTVPKPGSLALVGLVLAGFGFGRRRKA